MAAFINDGGARQEAKRMADVMAAFAGGAEVECNISDSFQPCWGRCQAPSWDWAAFNYRVKPSPPKPRTVTIFEHNGVLLGEVYADDGISRITDDASLKLVKFVEVIE